MDRVAIGLALLLALAIIAVGIGYVASPRAAMRSFGLPLPQESTDIAWWLRLKGVRDIVSGLVVLAVLAWDGPRAVGLVLLVDAIIPLGDMSMILAAKGSTRAALGIHGLTATLLVVAAIPLMMESL